MAIGSPARASRTNRIFFFQAEDGIRDVAVTGVQTCALPILEHAATSADACPMGSGALAGNSFSIGRNAIAKELGFSRITLNSLDAVRDRKSTRLNSSHGYISYAVFCLKKKKHTTQTHDLAE